MANGIASTTTNKRTDVFRAMSTRILGARYRQPLVCGFNTERTRMKRCLIFLAPVLLANLSCGRNAQVPKRQTDFAMRVAKILPAAWTLEENGSEVIIFRREPITKYGCVGLDLGWFHHPELLEKYVQEDGIRALYKIRLRRAAKMDASEYARLKAVNDQIPVSKSTFITNREFYEAEAMRSFDPRYRELPEFFDDSSSIYVETTLHPWECVHPISAAKECETIWNRLHTLFSLYSKDDYRRRFSFSAE